MQRRLFALLGSFVLLVTLSTPAWAIVYGQRDTNEDYPNVGAIIADFPVPVLDENGDPVIGDDGEIVLELLPFLACSGTLIAPDVFLTAAHCVLDPSRTQGAAARVTFDQAVPLEPPWGSVVEDQVTVHAGRAYFHELAFTGGGDWHDIAIIELDTPITDITPATLPVEDLLGQMTAQQLKSEVFTAVGYGAVRDTRTKAWQSLSDSEGFRSFADQSALSLTKPWLTLSMNQATGDGGTCYGDSGGPHFLDDGTVVSITVTGDVWCKATDKTYRVDTFSSLQFLSRFLDD